MYSTCIFCGHDLQTNEVIESFPVGRRLAFDSTRGRLWVVCQQCERWNLTPFETRWEAIETCERIFRAERKRITTEQIGLAKVDEGLELVRIGKPLKEEFAGWRYGDQFGRRRRRAIVEGVVIAGAGGATLAGALAIGAVAGLGVLTYHVVRHLHRRNDPGRVIGCVPTVDGDTVTVLESYVDEARLKSDLTSDGRWKLVLPHQDGTITMSSVWAVHALGMLMPTINGTGGSAHRVHRALKRIEAVQHVDHFLQFAAAMSSHGSRPGSLGSLRALPVDVRLAVEMAVNEQNERFALEGEMWLLEFAWEQAEFVAQIADGLLVPDAIEAKLARLKERHRQHSD